MIKVRCENFKMAAALAVKFSKAYGDGRIKQLMREPSVTVDGNTFVFIYEGKPQPGEVSQSIFEKKYLTQKSQPV